MDDRWRLFIAIDLPDQIKAALGDVQQQLRKHALPVTWVRPAAMHLTLHFLGATAVAQVPALGNALRQAAANSAPFLLHLATAGAFPQLKRPQVVWVGIDGQTAALGALHKQLASALASVGFQPEAQPFHPHLTLGRTERGVDSGAYASIGAALQSVVVPPLEWQADQVMLMQSELRSDGAHYTARATVML